MSNFVSVIAVGYLSLVLGMFVFQRSLMYFPSADYSPPSANGMPEMTEVDTLTGDGLSLRSWYAPARPGRPTLVFFQGNAGNISHRGYKVRPFLDAGMGVMMVGYRGYGGNPGSPSEEGLYADARAVLGYLQENGVKPRDIVLYGESLGTGVAVHLARQMARGRSADSAAGAVILEAPFTSVVDVAADRYFFIPARWLVRDRFDSMEKIADIKAPVLMFHGEQDNVIPIRYGRRLFEAAAQPKESRWFPGAGHTDLHDRGAREAVLEFLEKLWPGKPLPVEK